MKNWRLLPVVVLALSLIAVGAHAQIPSFMQPGFEVTYTGKAQEADPQARGDLEPSSQSISMISIDANANVVNGITSLTVICDPKLNGGVLCLPGQKTVQKSTKWHCPFNPTAKCIMDTPMLPLDTLVAGIAQFWVDPDPTKAATSIVGPNNEHYVTENPCPAEVTNAGISNTACLHYIKCKSAPLNDCPKGPGRADVIEELLLAYDTTGLVRYAVQYFSPQATAQGPAQGYFIYSPQLTIPWQVDGTNILLQADTGDVAILQTNGVSVMLKKPDPGWHVIGTNYFNANGKFDILWQNNDGGVAVWELNGTSVIFSGYVGTAEPGWRAVGAGDFFGRHVSDILFQNNSGDVEIWEMNGTSANPHYVGNTRLGGWHVVGAGDFNGDGFSDILFQNDNRDVAIWEMHGTSVLPSSGYVGTAEPGWHAVGTGDFFGRHVSDILFQSDSGDIAIWEMNGTKVMLYGYVDKAAPGWRVVGVGDYNGDGKSDILFQNDNGDIEIWEMNGTSYVASYLGNPGPGWHI
jgi:hypothetical protein